MPDTTPRDPLRPVTDADVAPSSADAPYTAAEPVKGGSTRAEGEKDRLSQAKQLFQDNTAKVKDEATDKARSYAVDGKAKATGALSQLSEMLNDAAGQVDERMGDQYGQYARMAAEKVSGFSATLDQKDVDELLADMREMVRKSPAIAIGAAAAVGFVLARLLTAGVDQRGQA